ncbi:cobalt ECF transporter T component CbiQ [Candidatus Pyrohabitans sp.]
MHIEQVFEGYAHYNKLGSISPQLKLFLAASALLVAVFSTSPVAPVFIFLAMSTALLFMAGIPLKAYSGALAAPALFTLPVALLMPFFVAGGEPVLTLKLFSHAFIATREGVNEALLLASRVLAGSSSLFFIIFTTPAAALFAAMRSLRIPALFVEMCMLIYRFLFVLIDEAERMLTAQKLRLGYASYRRSFDSFALLASNLFLRSYLRAEHAFSALEARGYGGSLEFAELKRARPSLSATISVLTFSVLLATLAYFTRNMELV